MPAFATKQTDSGSKSTSSRHSGREQVAVSRPGDRFEREADHNAARVVRGMPAGPVTRVPGSMRLVAPQQETDDEELVQRKAEDEEDLVQTSPEAGGAGPPSAGGSVSAAIGNPSGGGAMQPATRLALERGFGANLGHVRVHEGAEAREAASQINARAFTHGNHIWLGEHASQSDVRLMAHETTHVFQQGGADRESAHVQRTPLVQRNILDDIGDAASAVGGFVADQAWSLIEHVAPARVVSILREISQVGLFTYLSNLIRDTASSVFDGLNSLAGGRLTPILELFQSLAGRVGEILGALASGSCEPLFAAVRSMKEALTQMASDAWEAIADFFRPIGEFFSDLWQRFGAPVVEWLQAVASDTWQFIQDLGNQIWDATEPLRTGVVDLWTDFKNLLGIGGSDDGGGGGLIGWITDMAGRAWDAIKAELQPVIEPIQQVVARVQEFLPLDAILNLRETVLGWLDSVTSMADAMDAETGVVDEQVTLRETILPAVIGRIEGVRASLIGAGAWVAAKIGSLTVTILSMLGTIAANPILGAFSGAISWLQETAISVSTWAMTTVQTVFTFFAQGLGYLQQFIIPIYDTLQRIVSVIGDLMGRLPDLLLGPVWAILPACIKNPIKDFFVEQILSRIPIFSQLLAIPDIWARIQSVALRILQQVFVDGNLAGAAWTFFREILGLLGIPPELVVSILRNAAQAIGDILRDPVGFLINLVRSLALGFRQFLENILTHLLAGIGGWLFGQLRTAGIEPPTDFSFRSILGLVLQILDITVERVLQRLARRIGQERVDRLRRALDMATGAWEWFRRIITDGPAAIWEFIQERISDLWTTVRDGIIQWLTTNIISRVTARLLSMLDPSGIMAVVNTLVSIYQAIQSFFDYLREMMEIVNNFLAGVGQIARGVITEGANFLERSLAQAIPVAIGFLANQAGLRNLSTRIREMVEAVRARVDAAIDWVIDRAIQIGQGLLNLLQRGASAVRGGVAAVAGGIRNIASWWTRTRGFTDPTGESHTLAYRGSEGNAVLVIHSTELEVRGWLATLADGPEKAEAEAAYNEHLVIQGRVAQLSREVSQLTQAGSPGLDAKRAELDEADGNLDESFRRMARAFSAFSIEGEPDVPLALPRQKGIHAARYQALIDGGHLQHSVGRRGRETDQRAGWIRQMRGAMPESVKQHGFRLAQMGREYGWQFNQPDQVFVPNWSERAVGRSMQVDHIIEWQVRPLGSADTFDQPHNFELLEASANQSSGSTLRNSIEQLREHLAESGDRSWIARDLTFTQLDTSAGSENSERWSWDDIESGRHLDAYASRMGVSLEEPTAPEETAPTASQRTELDPAFRAEFARILRENPQDAPKLRRIIQMRIRGKTFAEVQAALRINRAERVRLLDLLRPLWAFVE